jgi:hypothetical protein
MSEQPVGLKTRSTADDSVGSRRIYTPFLERAINCTTTNSEKYSIPNFSSIYFFSPETAVGVHGFSVFLYWQFHFDKNWRIFNARPALL